MKILNIKSNIYKKILGILGATGFIFTFQACYGTPQNYIEVSGNIKDGETDEAIENIQVSVYSSIDSVSVTTNENGNFSSPIISLDETYVKVVDVNGEYQEYDTVLTSKRNNINIKLHKK